MKPHITPDDFWTNATSGDGCWEWTGYPKGNHYGAFEANHVSWVAHRYSWTLTYGPIPDGLWVLHHCDNRRCIRPDHLFLGTHADNMADMKAKGRGRSGNVKKAECPRGHPMAGANLYVGPTGMRQCKTCRAARTRSYWRRSRGCPACRAAVGSEK